MTSLIDAVGGVPPAPTEVSSTVVLSDEQQAVVDAVLAGENVIVDATCGSGKTATIQQLCALMNKRGLNILYLTYSRLLKADAQGRVGGAKVQNYHGIVYPYLRELGISAGLSDSIKAFNDNFVRISPLFPAYDLLVIDEYQDINSEYAQLLRNIKSKNPLMQIVMVGDRDQKVQANTTLDAVAFATEFTDNRAVLLPFTQSFRLGPAHAALVGQAWNKPIIGVNTEQEVLDVSFDEAVNLIAATDPADLLVLGKRNGPMVHALNLVEKRLPHIYNKSSVFASIRDGAADSAPDSSSAVFTTFDASKGMERPVCVVFDYRETVWQMRCDFPDADHEVLRNVFLVAASRGKATIAFVKWGAMEPADEPADPRIGMIGVQRFTDLPQVGPPQYSQPFSPSGAFDFTYAENVAACMELIVRERLDDGTGVMIEPQRVDGLIDLSPVIGIWQEGVFFEQFSATERLMLLAARSASDSAMDYVSELSKDPWRNALVIMSADTGQDRYLKQVSVAMEQSVATELTERLSTGLDPACDAGLALSLEGTAVAGRAGPSSPISFYGIVDAMYEGSIYELKFTSELGHPAFLQAALYLVMATASGFDDISSTILWNTRTDERWEITVPDPQRFMDAVVTCVSKQSYRAFRTLDGEVL